MDCFSAFPLSPVHRLANDNTGRENMPPSIYRPGRLITGVWHFLQKCDCHFSAHTELRTPPRDHSEGLFFVSVATQSWGTGPSGQNTTDAGKVACLYPAMWAYVFHTRNVQLLTIYGHTFTTPVKVRSSCCLLARDLASIRRRTTSNFFFLRLLDSWIHSPHSTY